MDVAKREFPKRPPKEPLTSLVAIVSDYSWRFPRARRDMVVEYCADAPTLRAAIIRACASRGENGKMWHHQTRVPEAVRSAFADNLLREPTYRRIKSVKKSARRANMSAFDLLHRLCDEARPEKGIGPVTTYDVAVRIGAFLGVAPETLFLHAGVREGVDALSAATGRAFTPSTLSTGRIPRSLLVHAFPEFRALPTDEVEDLLCTYRDVFSGIEKGRKHE